MATYSSHRLIMGKEESNKFFCLIEDIWICFIQKCLLSSPIFFIRLLSKPLNLIDEGLDGDISLVINGLFSIVISDK